MGLLEGSSGRNGILTVVFASLFLVSIGVLSHNAFADAVTATIPVNGAIRVAANPNTHLVYVATGQSQLQVINGSNSTVIATIQTHAPTPCPDSTAYVAVNPVADLIYAGSEGCMYKTGPPSAPPQWIYPTVSIINGSTNQIVSTVNFGAVQQPIPIPIAVNPVTNKAYVELGGQVDVINETTDRVVAYIDAGGNDIAANPQTDTIYVLDKNVIRVIDGKTDSVVTSFSWGKTSYYDIGVNPATNRIYVSNNDNTVSVIDGSTYQVIATVNGTAYGLVGVNSVTNKIYVSSPGASHYVTVIDGATNNIASQILVGQNSYGIGADMSANKIYVANAGDKTVSVIDGNAPDSSPPATPPSPPQNLQAAPVSYSQVSLSWAPPADNGSSPIIGYKIERSNDGGNTWSTIGGTKSNSTSYSNAGLLPNTSYAYRVSAINWDPVASTPSNTASTTTPQGGFIALNNVQSASGTISSSTYQFILPNFNAGSGTNRLLLVGIDAFPSHFSINPVVTSVTFNGVPLTESVQSNQDGFWYLKDPTGTGTITVTAKESLPLVVGAYAFRGVDLTNPIPNSAVNWSPMQTMATQYPNDWVVDLVSDYWDTYPISNPTCTQQWDLASGFYTASSAASSASPGPVTCSWTSNPGSQNWNTQIVEIKAANSTAAIQMTPYPPQNLQASSRNYQVNLSWTAPANNGGSAITSYNVYRGLNYGTESLLAKAGNVTSYNDTTISDPNTGTYYYKVTAVNSLGESSSSNEVHIYVPSNTVTAPDAPTNLEPTLVSSSQIDLIWAAPANNGGSPVTGYMIQRSTDGGVTWSTIASNTGSTTAKYNDTGLSPSTTYSYQVSAINSAGTSAQSNTASATTNAVTTTGIVLNNVQSTSGTTSSSNQITLPSFNAGTGSNNLLVVGVGANNAAVSSVTFGGIQLTKAVSSFSNNDAEFWYLKDPIGTGDITVTMNGQTQAVAGAYSFSGVNQTMPIPTHLAKHNTTPNSPNISITTKYPNDWVLDLPSIYGGEKLGSPTCMQQWNVNVPNAITDASSSTVAPSPTTVTCKWTASSADLWDDIAVEIGSYTTSGTGTSTATAPSSPTGLTATPGNAQVALSWTAPASNGGSAITNYKIYRSTSSGTETFLAQAGNVTSYTDTGLTNGVTYFYKVTAVNSAGESSQSNEDSAMPTAPTSISGDTVIATIPLGNHLPFGTGVNPNTDKIYVSSRETYASSYPPYVSDNNLFVINGTTDSILYNVTVGGEPSGVGVNPKTNKIYVSNYGSETVSVLDGTTDSIIDTITVGGTPWGVGVNPNTGLIYVSDPVDDKVFVINGTTDTVTSTISVGAGPGSSWHYPLGIGVNPNTNMIYVAYNYATMVGVIDGKTNNLVTTISVGNSPAFVAVNTVTNRVYVANSNSNTVSVIDGTTNGVIGTITAGYDPAGVGVNPNTNKIYVSNYKGNTVSVIDGTTNGVIGTITTGGGPWEVGVNPNTNKIYVGNQGGCCGAQGPTSVTVIQGGSMSSGSGTNSGITLNNVQSTSGTTSSSNQITLSNFNAGTASNRLLLVGVSANNNNVASVTFNGTPLTRAVSSFYNNDAELWYLTNPSGTGDIAVTMNGATQAVVGAYSFSGVNQSSPIPAHRTSHNTSAGSPSISVTTQYPNDWVLDLPSIYGGSTLGSPTCTQQWDVNVPNAITGASSSTMVSSPSTVTCKWAASSADFWDDVAVELKAN